MTINCENASRAKEVASALKNFANSKMDADQALAFVNLISEDELQFYERLRKREIAGVG